MIQPFEEQGIAKLSLWELFRCLLPPHLPRQIFLPLLAQEFGRALTKFRIVRQPIERIPQHSRVVLQLWSLRRSLAITSAIRLAPR